MQTRNANKQSEAEQGPHFERPTQLSTALLSLAGAGIEGPEEGQLTWTDPTKPTRR